MENNMTQLVQKAMQLLRNLGLTESTLKSYETRSFRPILDYYQTFCINDFQESLMFKLEILYQDQLENGLISRTTFNRRVRGLRIISEIHATDCYKWKVYSHKKTIELSDFLKTELKLLYPDLIYQKRENKT